MKAFRIILLAMVFVVSGAWADDTRNLSVATAGSAGKRIALVIGNDQYSSVTPLKNAVADARAMAAALGKAGFDVTLRTDANLGAMKLAVRQFKARLSGGDEAVFFYSGHGVQLGAANYLLPVDITSDSEEQVKDDAIPLQRLLDDLQDKQVKFALAIVDACRDNPFKGRGRSIGGTRGLAPTSAANGQMVIFSAGSGQQALDKLGDADMDGNGVFTRVFLQEMVKPGIEVHQVLRNVRSRVVQMARSVDHDQMPALYDQVEGDFSFYPGAALPSASLLPGSDGGFSLEDIKKQQAARVQWAAWQAKMRAAFDQAAKFGGSSDLQLAAWDRFLSAYGQDNPFSTDDEKFRAQALGLRAQSASTAEQRQSDEERQRLQAEAAAIEVSVPVMIHIPGRNYELAQFEESQAEWRAVMGNSPSQFKSCGASCPVEQVSWDDIQVFLQKINAMTGRHYRLPTEEEWEYACYGGSQSDYCGGNDMNAVAWTNANSLGLSHPAGQKLANGYGLFDMSGNVWEWVSDCREGNCTRRVVRGGAWNNNPQYAHASYRSRVDTAHHSDYIGFRLARTLP
ncbi:MAG: SUMF1/EgtB/PvdO family nonheme iron enzyme [Gallionella sp.]|nr:SUMF1/EgtB/PvdO family nonheme iron enzyme [Gallionella sp.]